MPALTDTCDADEYCQEGTCYKLLAGEDGALQQGLWTQQPTPTTYVLRALWGTPDGADIFSVGDHGTILHLSGAGPAADSGWTTETSNTTENLYAVYGTAVNDVWAAGADGTFLHRDASGWTVVPQTSTARIDGLFSDLSNDAWAVGRTDSTTPVILHYSGSPTWAPVTVPAGATDLRAIWGTSGTDLWAVGNDSNILHGDGTTFTVRNAPATMQEYTSVGGSASGVYIVGRGGVILNSDLTQETSPVSTDLFHVWASPSGADVFAVGDFGVILHRENGAWVQQPAKTDQPLFAVWGTKSGDLFAAGRDGVILHNTGAPSQCALDSDCRRRLLRSRSSPRIPAPPARAWRPRPRRAPAGSSAPTRSTARPPAPTTAAASPASTATRAASAAHPRRKAPTATTAPPAAARARAARVCLTGLSCTDHVCCDKSPAQCGGCMRCNAPTGTCGPVPFAQDPHGACTGMTAVCAGTTCNGQGGCGNYGDSCGAPSCDGTNTEVDGSACQNGSCVTAPAVSPCPSPFCTGDMNNCTSPTGPPNYCTKDGLCVPSKGKGAAVQSDLHQALLKSAPCAECGAGLACVDGFCCDAACTGQCQACDLPSQLGHCTTVTSGPPHGSRQACSGSGACAAWCDGSSATACTTSSAQCAPPSCDGSNNYTLNAAASCASGACAAPAKMSCAPFACVDNACRTTCRANSDCASTTPTCDVRTHTCR